MNLAVYSNFKNLVSQFEFNFKPIKYIKNLKLKFEVRPMSIL